MDWMRQSLVLGVLWGLVVWIGPTGWIRGEEPGDARIYYVAKGGDDRHPGTENRPFRTISQAVSVARAGDEVRIREGVYREAVVLRDSGREGRPIVIRNYPGEEPVIQPGEEGKPPPGQGICLQAREGYKRSIGWITIAGLEIRHGHDGIKIYNGHDIVIRDCRIHHNWKQGILGNGNRVWIDGNVIAHNGTSPDEEHQSLLHGIYGTGSDFRITNNLIHSNRAYGIQVAAYAYDEGRMAGPEYAGAKDWLIANNTLANNRHRSGIVVWKEGVEDCVIQNNIFYRNASINGIRFYSQAGKRHLVRNNLFYPAGRTMHPSGEGAYVVSGNQEVDPAFMDAEGLDFRLSADSPAIDAGIGDRSPDTDIEGTVRPQGQGVDLGAYEVKPGRDR